jgi:hypothetical protein
MTEDSCKEETVSDRTWQGHQSWNRELIVRSTDPTRMTRQLRYRVKCDAYDFQSYAVAEIWSSRDQEWKQVHRIPGQKMLSKVSYVAPFCSPSSFDDDLKELKRVAMKVVLP